MIDFVKYVVSELKSTRLSKTDALGLIKQFSRRPAPSFGAAPLHPLLHCNTSDLTQQSWATRFSGDEFFLRDHCIAGKQVLPGVAYLEMARAAIALALPEQAQHTGFELRHVAWAQPIVFPQQRDVVLALCQGEPDADAQARVEFEVYSAQDTVHCQGSALFGGRPAPIRRDLAMLNARMSKGRLDASTLYSSMARMGITLGPAHQGVTMVHQGEQELLVEITLPDLLDATRDEYVLHPSVLDSALQAAMALVIGRQAQAQQPPIPFALEVLRVFGRCEKQMLAWVRHAPASGSQDRIVKLDIDLCDAQGQVRVQMLGFSARVLSADIGAPGSPDGPSGCLLAAPQWEAGAPLSDCVTSAASDLQLHIVLCDLPTLHATQLASGASGADRVASCLALSPAPAHGLGDAYTEVVLACFEQLRSILAGKPQARVLVQMVVPNDAEHRVYAGLRGLFATASRENPLLIGQLVFADADIATDALATLLAREAGVALHGQDLIVKYQHGQRQALRWRALEETWVAQAPVGPAFRSHGVYLITGGLGALGVLFAKEILARSTDATVVLTGRRDPSADQQAMIDRLNAGATQRVHYRRLDLCDADQVVRTLAGISQTFGPLTGILHSAGMVLDNFILKKSVGEIRQVFGPKVAGTCNLDQASRDIDLDFFVLFSSVVSVFGNAGQADYAAANGFMDGFAAYRNGLAASKRRRGIAVAINWPLWQEGGMALVSEHRAMLERATGMQAMQTATGMLAFHSSLRRGCDQLLVVQGELERMRQTLLGAGRAGGEVEADVDVAPASVTLDADSVLEQTQAYLRKQFSQVLKLAPQRIDPQAPLERYGIDSIVAMDLTSQLEITFGALPKTLFFEYQTVGELSQYFVRAYPQQLASLFSASAAHAAVAAPRKAPVRDASTPAVKPSTGRHLHRRGARVPVQAQRGAEPIAIVGLSGRYPESADIEAFWHNLREGKDCITEIPKDRWDWRDYYSEDRSAPGCHYSKWGGFISGVDEFDPLFFSIPPVDAELIDPQERLFLQHAWMAIEDAGYTRAGLRLAHHAAQAGQVGVYVGVMYGEYQLFGAEASLRGQRMGVPQSYASIANRVSYILDLHGPSMTLDSMCSSSLTAIHLACQDLKQGRTNLAIAGGVNVTIHPNKYLILSAGQFISSDGHCHSFGQGGDGYIPGEGVGAVVLKRLSEAEQDGNHIYGVIKGSALNHGGKTNGYSVPNPKAQASVIALALEEYGLDARQVSYIEAHGTGTKLGDPIEIAALTQVFGQHTKARQFCVIGSAKSNIGHCESAAGIAGLTKVLLQMKHRMIVPSLHASVLNPHIDFEASPFVVNQTLRAWEQPLRDGQPVPRIAGISSFGAGGSNAHLVVEEYPAHESADRAAAHQEPEHPQARAIIVLSARTKDQLRRKAADLLAFIGRPAAAIALQGLAYTLQVGREAMDQRLALVVGSISELAHKLQAYGQDEPGIDQCFQGQIEPEQDHMAVLSLDEDMVEAIHKWIARKKLAKLADLWVKGLELDWRQLHAYRTPSLISLPTYPFAKDRYRVKRTVNRGSGHIAERLGAPLLHPLLHRNTSDFFQQSFACEFSGEEFFLADHRIGAEGASLQKVLPGVAYLEMIRAAVDLALPGRGEGLQIEIRNVAWAHPIVVDGGQQVSVAMSSAGESSVDFEVRSAQDGTRDETVHCQGQVEIVNATRPNPLDLDALKTDMTRGVIAPQQIYRAFKAMGIDYGPSFCCIAALYRGHDQVLAELVLPDALDASLRDYVLHPGLLDSALQAAIGLVAQQGSLPKQASVPFALDSIVLVAPCVPCMFAWVRYAPGDQIGAGISKIDIDLCDQHGSVCARLRGLVSRTLPTGAAPATLGTLIACPSWEPVAMASDTPLPAMAYRRHQVLLCDLPRIDLDQLEAVVPGIETKRLSVAGADNLAVRYCFAALVCFEELNLILGNAPHEKALFQLVIGCEGDDALLAGLSGLIDTARLENPNLIGQVILT